MSVQDFYTAASQVCFTMLGFWWVVVQFRHKQWTQDPAKRLMAHAVSLHFLFPATMCLISLLALESKIIWRVTFGVTGLLGVVAMALLIASMKVRSGYARYIYGGLWVALAFYVLVTVFAVMPELAGTLFGLQPLQVEGIILSLLVFMGVNFAWLLFIEPSVGGETPE